MNNQHHALYALIESGKLSQTEVAGLTLGDLNLAGNNPEIKVWDEETGQRRSIAIDVQTRDILVTWLVARPPPNRMIPQLSTLPWHKRRKSSSCK